MLTESIFSPFNLRTIAPFVLIISQKFCALLQGEMIHFDGSATAHQNPDHNGSADALCQMGLTFEPETIAAFLTRLETLLPAPILQRLRAVKAPMQPNDAKLQTDFTLQLIELLVAAPYTSAAETALRQQVEQERLINDVTTLIRQSLELPVILETAVQQVRQFLKADRLIIYQFNTSAPSCLLKSEPNESTWTDAPPLDGITYEARKNDSIPSILHQLGDSHPVRLRCVDWEEITWASDHAVPFVHSERVQAELMTPIVVRDEVWGLLIAHQCFAPRHWQDPEKAFLQRIAGHLAIAIYQAKLYAQVNQQKATLEQQVIERTQELCDTLVAAQSASRAKTEFLATMSHELRSPLTTIIGMASTLLRYQSHSHKKGALTLQKQQEYLQTIQGHGEHLLALINDILDLSQVETGKTILDVREFSLFELAQHTLSLLNEKADRSQIQLHLDWRSEAIAEIEAFKADYHRVKQILVNLLSNAIKFTLEGGSVTLRIWLNDDTAILQVEDTGIGIPEHQIPLLFQKFQQLDASYHRTYEGTGLGLALTKQLVELHSGKIEVTSTVGVGSRFTVHLPAQSLSAIDRAKKRLTTALHPRILLIESHEETATLICNLLTAANYQVVWTIEGTTALRQIEMLQPVAVIVDSQLLGMDGYKVIGHLRQDPTTPCVKVLALITQADAHLAIQCLEAGADDYLVKPISQPEQLIDKVTALVMERSDREL
ncbi:ATP-binding protein [Phormidesmis priestleyi ANT.L61.2]